MHAPTLNSSSYLQQQQISSGGMADIFLCTKNNRAGFKKNFILKKISKDLLENLEVQQLFRNEMKIHSLLYHPNIIQLIDITEESFNFVMILEYFPGYTLRQILNQAKNKRVRIPLSLCLKIIYESASALKYLHDLHDDHNQPLGLIHCDLSPTNILLSPQGVSKICDFGLAKGLFQKEKNEVGITRGKLIYMSPEQLHAQNLDFRSDIFSLALCLAEMLMPELDFSRIRDHKQRDKLLKKHLKKIKVLPYSITYLLKTALEQKPHNRFASSEQFFRACQAAYHDSLTSTPAADFSAFMQHLFNPLVAAEEPVCRSQPLSNNLRSAALIPWILSKASSALAKVASFLFLPLACARNISPTLTAATKMGS